jgi:hypothetical protein
MSRFKKGQSGNPKGRPPKPKSDRIDIKTMLKEALNDTVNMRMGDKEERTTYLKAGLMQLVHQYAKGDAKARRDMFWLAEKHGINLAESVESGIGGLPAADHRAVLEAYIAARNQASDRSAAEPVIAPPDLQDDDPSEDGGA